MKKALLFCFLLNCCSINIIHAQLFGGLIKSSEPVVTIGTQKWMEENLEVVTYRDGTVIPQVTDATAWAGLTTGAWCYNYDPANGAIYGKLYNWYAVMGIASAESATPTPGQIAARKQLAPRGWHIPTDDEWTTLGDQLGGDIIAGGKMKTTGTTRWKTPNTGATNVSGFAGLPGGCRYYDGRFQLVGDNGYWWSATEYPSNSSEAYLRYLKYDNGSLGWDNNEKKFGFSVRCLRD